MKNSIRKPMGFFGIAAMLLIILSIMDIGLFHFFTDFFNIVIGFMIFLIVLNSKVYSEKSALLTLATAYLYISCFDLFHLITVFDITSIGVNLNESYLAFAFARFLEALIMIVVFGAVRKTEKVNYIFSHILGSVLLVVGIYVIRSGFITDYFIEGSGHTVTRLVMNYIIVVMFLFAAFLVYNSKMDTVNKSLLAGILILKAVSQSIHASFTSMGDVHQVVAMLLRFISYGGLYVLFIKEIVSDPYNNVYKLFSRKEKHLVSLSERDSLTGVFNHSMTFKNIEKMILDIGKESDDLCVILFDIDNFKQINDSYGHIKGDEMIIKFTSILNDLNHFGKMVGRYGGDEFVLAIPNCNESNIDSVFDQIKIKLIEAAYEDGVAITFSAGAVTWRIGNNATDLIRKADIKMYESKGKGKNQYCVWKHDL